MATHVLSIMNAFSVSPCDASYNAINSAAWYSARLTAISASASVNSTGRDVQTILHRRHALGPGNARDHGQAQYKHTLLRLD